MMLREFLMVFMLGSTVSAGPLSKMNDEALAQAFHDDSSADVISMVKSELGGGDAQAFVDRCKRSPELKGFLTGFPQFIESDSLKRDVIFFVLSEDGVWEKPDDEDVSSAIQVNSRKAYSLAYPALVDALGLSASDPVAEKLQAALMTPEGRSSIEQIYRRIVHFGGQQSSEVKRLHVELAAVIERYGSQNFVRSYYFDSDRQVGELRHSEKGAVDHSRGTRGKAPAVMSPVDLDTGEGEPVNRWLRVVLWGLLAVGGIVFAIFAARKRVM